MNNIEDLKNLLLKQYELHPKMQIQDMVKLIYQNEFAGGHLIVDEIDSLKRIKDEYHFLKLHSDNRITSISPFEDIGNGLCRLHLSAIDKVGLSLEDINRFFIDTANSVSGSIENFEEKLEIVKECCKEKSLPFSFTELEFYLNEYKSQGYPPVSHSEEYKYYYQPAYRIVRKNVI